MKKEFLNIYKQYLVEAPNRIQGSVRIAIQRVIGFKETKARMKADVGRLWMGDTDKTLKANGQEIRAGKALRKFIPDLTDQELNDILGDIKKEFLGETTWELYDNVHKGYRDCYEANKKTTSCMINKPKLLKFYEWAGTKVLVLKEDVKVLGRALVWFNTVDSKGNKVIFMDRVYPPENDAIVAMFRDYAVERGWAYREGGWNAKIIANGNVRYGIILKHDIEGYDNYLPYMDTLRGIELDDYISNQDLWHRANDVGGTHSTTGKYK